MAKSKKLNKHERPGTLRPEDFETVKDRLLVDARVIGVLIILIAIGLTISVVTS